MTLVKDEYEDTKGGNQKPYIEEEQTIQWPKEKVQKNKQRSTKHTYIKLKIENQVQEWDSQVTTTWLC